VADHRFSEQLSGPDLEPGDEYEAIDLKGIIREGKDRYEYEWHAVA
jgi:hypothetical protein